jgi:peptidoglycan/xylan/chitin deacetylase (PgdA/CDA1 family)
MALAATNSMASRPQPAGSNPDWSNDAFTFWKLPTHSREALEPSIVASVAIAEWHMFERYLPERDRHQHSVLRAYYLLKRFVPLWLRHAGNSLMARSRRVDFPAWPRETSLMDFWTEWLEQSLIAMKVTEGWHIGFWPEGRDCCIALTHDVESPSGFARMERMAEMEAHYGFRSAWNLPLDQYPIDWKIVERLRARGFEFGAHGLNHDGRLFRSREDFQELAPRVERLAREHGLRGFRSPSTLRNVEWIPTMDFDYDGSFSDTDPYEPQPGGTCSIFPFFLGAMVELPYTLAQDHTLTTLLHRCAIDVWRAKADWIASLGGMILTLVHPDYSGAGAGLREYEDLLKHLSRIRSAWRALPGEVAAWWRRRALMELSIEAGRPVITGPDIAGGVARRLASEPLAHRRST